MAYPVQLDPLEAASVWPGAWGRHAHAIAEAVEQAWHRTHGTGDVHIPVSVIAGLSLTAPDAADLGTVTGSLLDCDPAALARLTRTQWTVFVHARPDLVIPAWPLLAVWHGHPTLDPRRPARPVRSPTSTPGPTCRT